MQFQKKKKGPFERRPDQDGIRFAHLNPHLHTKKKKEITGSIFLGWGGVGIYILASVRTKLCIFQKKLEITRKEKQKTTVMTEEQSFDASALACEEAAREVGKGMGGRQ